MHSYDKHSKKKQKKLKSLMACAVILETTKEITHQ